MKCFPSTWIEQALFVGGTLTLKSKKLERTFTATMKWPNLPDLVFSKESPSLERALADLNESLCADAAEEMRKSGAV